MKHSPTDLELLDKIYERHYDAFAGYEEGDKSRSSKIYVPLDIPQLAKDMDVDPDIIFGRLYYHLDKKHGYRLDDGSFVHFFAMQVGGDHHCINFPYLASVLASLRDESRKYRITTAISVVSLFISLLALFFSLFYKH